MRELSPKEIARKLQTLEAEVGELRLRVDARRAAPAQTFRHDSACGMTGDPATCPCRTATSATAGVAELSATTLDSRSPTFLPDPPEAPPPRMVSERAPGAHLIERLRVWLLDWLNKPTPAEREVSAKLQILSKNILSPSETRRLIERATRSRGAP